MATKQGSKAVLITLKRAADTKDKPDAKAGTAPTKTPH